MSLYPHWLDGEILLMKTITNPSLTLDTVQTQAEKYLKLLAIMGSDLALSNVQIFDSAVILGLFSNVEFRSFLRENPNFMSLVLAVDKSTFSSGPPVMMAFAPTTSKGWQSSTFSSPDLTRFVRDLMWHGSFEDAPTFFRNRLSDLNEAKERFCKGPDRDKSELVDGMIWAVDHFIRVSKPVTREIESYERWNFYEMLKAAKNSPLTEHDLEILNNTISFIDNRVPPENRDKRSAVLLALGERSTNAEFLKIWYTVVYAWNSAVQHTVSANGGTLESSGYGVSVGSFFDLPRTILVPNAVKLEKPTRNLEWLALKLKCDPTTLSWHEISELMRETRSSRGLLVTASESGDQKDYQEAFNSYVEELNEKILVGGRTSEFIWALLELLPGVSLIHLVLKDVLTDVRRQVITNTITNLALKKP